MYEKLTTPATIGKVLDNAFRLFKESFVYCLPASLFVAFSYSSAQMPGLSPELMFESLWLFLVLMLVSYLLFAISMPALIHRMNGFADGAREPFKASLGVGLRKCLFVLGGLILYMLAVGVGLVLLVVPGVILMVSLALFLYGMIVDDFGAIASLRQSHRLVWGNWWRTTIIFTVAVFLAMVLYFIVIAVFGVVAAFTGDAAVEPGFGFELSLFLIVFAIYFLVTPLFVALGLSLYTDLSLRKRGEDLEARVDELQAT